MCVHAPACVCCVLRGRWGVARGEAWCSDERKAQTWQAMLTKDVLAQVVLLKLVQQLSQVYQTMRISAFAKLADFLSLHDCEKLIVQAVSNNQVPDLLCCCCASRGVWRAVGDGCRRRAMRGMQILEAPCRSCPMIPINLLTLGTDCK